MTSKHNRNLSFAIQMKNMKTNHTMICRPLPYDMLPSPSYGVVRLHSACPLPVMGLLRKNAKRIIK